MKGTFGFRSVWQVVQAFDWAWFVDPELNRTKCRMPTREEVRSMAWQAVAGGANGVLFWCFHHPYWKLPAEDFAQFQSDYAAVGAEIRSQIPVTLPPLGIAILELR